METPRVNIVDAINPKRLLGSILRPCKTLTAPYYCMAAMERLSVCSFDPNKLIEPVPITTIRMEVSWETCDDNWSKRVVFTTYNTLHELMMIRDFRLPGETDAQAYQRGYW